MIMLSQSEPQNLLAGERPGDLLNLCVGLRRRGLRWDEPSSAPRGPEWLAQESEKLAQKFRAEPEALKQLIEKLREFFDAVADGQVYPISFMSGCKFVLDAAAIKAGHDVRAGFTTPPTRDGFIQSVLLGAALFVCLGEDGALVRRCAREACRRIFLATRPKQIFCGRRCASAAVFERYKQKLGEEEYRAKHREVARRSKLKKQHRSQKRKEQ